MNLLGTYVCMRSPRVSSSLPRVPIIHKLEIQWLEYSACAACTDCVLFLKKNVDHATTHDYHTIIRCNHKRRILKMFFFFPFIIPPLDRTVFYNNAIDSGTLAPVFVVNRCNFHANRVLLLSLRNYNIMLLYLTVLYWKMFESRNGREKSRRVVTTYARKSITRTPCTLCYIMAFIIGT